VCGTGLERSAGANAYATLIVRVLSRLRWNRPTLRRSTYTPRHRRRSEPFSAGYRKARILATRRQTVNQSVGQGSARVRITWVPRCRTTANPALRRAAMQTLPEMDGSLLRRPRVRLESDLQPPEERRRGATRYTNRWPRECCSAPLLDRALRNAPGKAGAFDHPEAILARIKQDLALLVHLFSLARSNAVRFLVFLAAVPGAAARRRWWFEPNPGRNVVVQVLAHTRAGYVYIGRDQVAVQDVVCDWPCWKS